MVKWLYIKIFQFIKERVFLLSFKMIIFSYQASNNYVLYGFRRNTVASYQENLELARKKTKIGLA